jgi:hypothetical protein
VTVDAEVGEQAARELDAEGEARAAEYWRKDRWHATYNAALTGFLASSAATVIVDDLHTGCVALADRAHGPLTSKPGEP